jgi:cytochrome P450
MSELVDLITVWRSFHRQVAVFIICATLAVSPTIANMISLIADSLWDPYMLCVLLICLCCLYTAFYIVYQRWWHPLAKYPGPWLASITDLWQVKQFLSLKQPYNLADLHAKHGPVIRYGPDKISITHEEAIAAIYQAPSRLLPKTEFYDAFGGAHPNVFGTRDETHHSVRRRHMSHAFSMTSIKDMEQYIDQNIALLRQALLVEGANGKTFDLKQLLHNYVIDVLGELAFSKSFDLQSTGDRSQIPPVKEHTLLGSVMGSWPSMISTLKWWLPKLPVSKVQELFHGRLRCARLASECVRRRLNDVKMLDEASLADEAPRKDLLTTLIRAKDPDTGDFLTQTDLETEAFGFM